MIPLACPAGHPIAPHAVLDTLEATRLFPDLGDTSVRCTEPTCPHESPVTLPMLEAALAATMRGGDTE